MKRSSVIIPVIVLCASLCMAQSKPAPPSSAVPAMPPPAEINIHDVNDNRPAAEMQQLTSYIVGNWAMEQKIEPNESLSNGAELKGIETIRQGPGGLSIIGDLHATGSIKEFTAHRFILWDPKTKAMVSYWQDSLAPVMVIQNGGWEEKNKLVLRHTEEINGKKYEMREVFTDFTPEGFQAYMEMRSIEPLKPGAKNTAATAENKPVEWKRIMTTKYSKTRVSPDQWVPGRGPKPGTGPFAKPVEQPKSDETPKIPKQKD